MNLCKYKHIIGTPWDALIVENIYIIIEKSHTVNKKNIPHSSDTSLPGNQSYSIYKRETVMHQEKGLGERQDGGGVGSSVHCTRPHISHEEDLNP